MIVEVDVVDTNVPLLIGLDVMDEYDLVVDTVDNSRRNFHYILFLAILIAVLMLRSGTSPKSDSAAGLTHCSSAVVHAQDVSKPVPACPVMRATERCAGSPWLLRGGATRKGRAGGRGRQLPSYLDYSKPLLL